MEAGDRKGELIQITEISGETMKARTNTSL